jgi:signal transduction histidine kinase
MSLRPGLRKHNLTLNVECQPNLMMNSYPGPYGQVLTNLFLNSVAHAFPDGKAGTSISRCGSPARTMSRSCFPTMAAA